MVPPWACLLYTSKEAPPRFELCQTAEIGEGNLDMAGIIRAGALCGRPYMFIEQDQHLSLIHI